MDGGLGIGAAGGYVTLTAYPTWTTVASTTIFLPRTSYVSINGAFWAASVSTTQQSVAAQVLVDGTKLPGSESETQVIDTGLAGGEGGLHAFGVLTMTAGSHTITLEGAYVNGTTAPVVYDRVIAAVDDG